jgi:nitroreductase
LIKNIKIIILIDSIEDMGKQNFIKLKYNSIEESEMLENSKRFYNQMDLRRSVREFSDKQVPVEIIKNLIMTASTAPSGAHKQPWFFCAVSDKFLKHKIREAAEEEEYKSYHGRMSLEWLRDLEAFATDHNKPFLDIAPWIIVVFKKPYDIINGEKRKNYYVNESVGIAVGLLLAAVQNAGLVALTHTPSPMNFLERVLNRPENEKAFLLIPIGYPADNVTVPKLDRKNLNGVLDIYN